MLRSLRVSSTDGRGRFAADRVVVVAGAGSRGSRRRAISKRDGARVTVLEARDRVGGRVQTVARLFAAASTPRRAPI